MGGVCTCLNCGDVPYSVVDLSSSGNPKVVTPAQEQFDFHVVVVGDPDIGKTSLIYRYCESTFPAPEMPKESFKHSVPMSNGDTITLWIHDTVGQERFKTMTSTFYMHAAGILLCFDVTKRESYESVPIWLANIETYNNDTDMEIMLVGTKLDEANTCREVSKDEVWEFVRIDQRLFDYQEVSSKDGTSVETVFEMLAQQIHKSHLEGYT